MAVYLLVALSSAAVIAQWGYGEIIWPASAVYLISLTRREPRRWPALVVLMLCADFALGLSVLRLSAPASGLHAVELALETMAAAFVLSRHGSSPRGINTTRDVLILFVALCFAAPGVGAVFEAAAGHFAGVEVERLGAWYVHHILPWLAIAPLVVGSLEMRARGLVWDSSRSSEAAVLLALTVAAASIALGSRLGFLLLRAGSGRRADEPSVRRLVFIVK